MSENLLRFYDFISPSVRVIIKSKIETILNKIYPRSTTLKNILTSENLNINSQYLLMKNPIDLNKPIIDLVVKKKDILTEFELIIEIDILDLDFNTSNKSEIHYFKILRPFENPFRILCFSPKDNNISIIKFPYQTLCYLGLENFTCSKSSYCNTPYDLYISGGNFSFEDSGESKNFFKINNIKIKIEKLEELPIEKGNHSMIFIPKKYIYFIGGRNRGTFYYDIILKTFKLWAPLKSKKLYPALVLLNNSIIYTFGRQNKIEDRDFIEKTNIKSSPKWEVVNVKIGQPFTLRRFGAVSSNDGRIYFVGGRKEKGDKVFFFDVKNNQIDRSNQINSTIKISESNFYKLNEFTSVLLPQETKGDIKIIIFNRRTKRFRKAKYERDYDIISQKECLEIDGDYQNDNETKIKSEINYKKIENKYVEELKKQNEELKMPSLLDIKKILLGNKNILNKNVEAMVFNRKRIQIRKSDNIDSEESENEYEECKENDEMELNDLNNIKEDNHQKSINISLIKIAKEKNNDYNRETLKGIFNYNEDEPIFLKVKNPKINFEENNINYSFNNQLSFSAIKSKDIHSNVSRNNKNVNNGRNSPFEKKYNSNLSGFFKGPTKSANETFYINNIISDKEEIINISTSKINPSINKQLKTNKELKNHENNFFSNKKDNIPSNEKYINSDKDNNNLGDLNNVISLKGNISNINGNIKKSEININVSPKINNIEISNNKNINENIRSGIVSIIGDANKFYMKNTYKGLTLKDFFGRDVDEEISLNLAKVIIPSRKSIEISGIIEGKETGQIISANINNPNANIKYPENEKMKCDNESTTQLNNKNSGIKFNEKKANINNIFNPYITLREIFNKNINLNVKNPIITADNNYNISGIIDGKLPTTNIDINGPNINMPGHNLTGSINRPNISITGKIPNIDVNKPKLDSNISGTIPGIGGSISGKNIKVSSPIPDLDININGPNFGYDKSSLTLKKLCDGDINDDINLNIRNPKIWGYNNYNISGIIDGKLSTGNIDINGPNIDLPQFNLSGNINKLNINGKIPNVNANINKPNVNISGKIPGIDINMNGPNIENNSSLTLKEIFGGDVDDDINLNRYKLKINTNLPNEKITGIIVPSLLPSTNIDINGPNMNIPQVNLRGKKPELNASGKIQGLNVSVKKPKIDIDGSRY